MKRMLAFAGALAATVVGYTLLVTASIPSVPSNGWSAAGDLSEVRAGATATLLADGRVLIAGGLGDTGAVATAERFSPDTRSFLGAAPMQAARANHTATLLANGNVLVVGGSDASGQATASAELYDAANNVWLPAGVLNVARRGHTATRLKDGRVLIAGGDSAGEAIDSIEVFDPATLQFSVIGAMSSPRTQHAAAALSDGRVLIAGGNDGHAALASTDIVRADGASVSAGPAMAAARSGMSATALLDGRVLVAGGSDGVSELASAEVLDAAATAFTATDNALAVARQNHIALLLPHNNQVLIVGGLAGGQAVAAAEYFTPWEGANGAFCADAVCASGYAGPAVPATARAWAAGSALSVPADETTRSGPNDGLALVAGGTGSKTADVFGFATIKTDKEDYAPGTTVTITGSGWVPGEWVAIVLRESPMLDEHPLEKVQADENGNIVSTEFVPDVHDIGIRFYATAYGQASQAQTTFRDNTSLKNGGVKVIGAQSPNPVTAGGTVTYGTTGNSVTVEFNGNGSCTVSLSAAGLPAGATATFTPSSGTGTSSATVFNSLLTITTTAATPTGSHSFTVKATGTGGTGNDCSTSTSETSASVSLVVAAKTATTTSVATSVTPSTYGNSVTFTATVTRAAGTNTPTGTVAIKDGATTICTTGNLGGSVSAPTASCATSSLSASGSPHSITAVYAGDTNFTGSTSSAIAQVVNAKQLTVTGITASPKTYDGGVTVTLNTAGAALVGVVPGDSVTLSTSSASGAFVDANVGVGKTVNVSGLSISGTSAGNYTLTQPAATADIGPATLTYNATAANRQYGASNPSFTGTITGFVGSDTQSSATTGTLAFSSTATAASPVGTYAITGSGLTANNGNYSFVQAAGNATALTVTARPVTLSGSRGYDGTATAAASILTITNKVGADDVSLSGSATLADKAAGVQAITSTAGLTLQGTTAGNYTLTGAIGSVTIGARVVTLTGSRPYDGTTDAAAAILSISNLAGSDVVTLSGSAVLADKAVGSQAITSPGTLALGGADAASYTVTGATGSVTIAKATASVTPTPAAKTYGDADPTLTGTLTGFLAGDNVTATYSRTAGEAAGGTYTISATLSPAEKLGNYDITYNTAAFTIDKKTASVTPNAAAKTYGDADPALTGTLTGFLAGDSVVASYSRTAGEAAGGSYTITATLSPVPVLANYDITYNTAAFTINKKVASVTPNAAAKTYGDADPAFSGSLAGFLVADNVVANYSRTAGEAAGGSYTISATLSPVPVLANYDITYNTATFTINKKVASVTPNAAAKTYGDADPAFSGSLAGFLVADNVVANYSRTAGEAAGGTYTISATLSPVPVLANYDITYNTATFTINKKVASVTPNAAAKTYGDADPAFSGSLAGFLVADNVVANYSRTAGEAAGGTYTISATLSPVPVLANYDITYNTATFTINKKVASVTPNALAKTYGDADPTLTGTLAGFLAGDSVVASYSRTAGEAAGGSYTISATLSPVPVLGNYDITYNTATFTIDKKIASVTPNALAKTYGDADPAFSGSLAGFLVADNVVANYSRTAGEVAGGAYTISATLSPVPVLANYDITYNTATFTINKKVASVTPNALAKTYGDADPTLTGTLAGFLAGDNVTASYSRTAGNDVAGSPYTISATLSPAGVLGNYDITYNTAAFTINKKTASVTPNAAAKTYGDADPTLTGTLAGFLAGDNVTASYSRTAGNDVAGSPYTISATLSPAGVLGNYDITYNTAAFTINKKTASVTPNAAAKTYGDADPAFGGTLAGFLAADNVVASYGRTAGEAAGGTYTISATLSPVLVLGNYDITYNTAALAITPATLTVVASAQTKVYGDADPALTYAVTGLKFADTAAAVLTGALSRAAGETVAGSPYAIANGTLTSNTNYTISFTGANLTITKATLTVTANNATRGFGLPNPAFTASYSGFKLGQTLLTSGVTGSPSLTTTADENSSVAGSPYVITAAIGTLSAQNYQFTFVNGQLTVTSWWTTKGFYAPVDMTTSIRVWNTVKGGSTVPLKFEIFAGTAERTDVGSVKSLMIQPVSCTTGTESAVEETAAFTGGTSLRYDGTSGFFIANWQTPKQPNQCYQVVMTALDGTMINQAFFKTK